MAKFKMSVSQEAFDSRKEDSGDFVLPKPGLYVLRCTECEPGFTKDSSGNEDKNRPYLKFTYKIVGVGTEEAEPKENYGNIWDYMSFGDKSEWKRAEVLLAYGIASGAFEGELDTDDVFLNRKVLVRLKHEKGQTKDDPKQAKIARMFEADSNPNAVEEGEVDYGNDDEDTFGSSDPVYGDEEPFGDNAEPEEEESGDAEARREELAAMDLKALGAMLTENGGDPKACIVKGSNGKTDSEATKANVIDAILSLEEGDSDDPF
jgi:hypothetical protein